MLLVIVLEKNKWTIFCRLAFRGSFFVISFPGGSDERVVSQPEYRLFLVISILPLLLWLMVSANKTILYRQSIPTALGPMYAVASEAGICLLEFSDLHRLDAEFEDLKQRLNGEFLTESHVHIEQLRKELEEYFSGQRREFSVTFYTLGTEFQRRVWEALGKIAIATSCSYQALAESLAKGSATRAVAGAVAHNRIAIVIPCHRVVGKHGQLTGYAGGLERKRWLLDFEASF